MFCFYLIMVTHFRQNKVTTMPFANLQFHPLHPAEVWQSTKPYFLVSFFVVSFRKISPC